jgi:hypothetical protein
VIQIDEQILLAQQCVANLRTILLEVKQREQEILEYLSRGVEQRVAS